MQCCLKIGNYHNVTGQSDFSTPGLRFLYHKSKSLGLYISTKRYSSYYTLFCFENGSATHSGFFLNM